MAILGLFGRRDKHKAPSDAAKSTTASSGSVDTDDLATVPSLHQNAVYASSPTASSSKLMLAFRHKKSPRSPPPASDGLLRPPAPHAYLSSARSEPGHGPLDPPPTRSNLFSDSDGGRSVRSLPAHTFSRSREGIVLDDPNTSPPPKKSKGIFAWAHRERKQSKPLPATPDINLDTDSFNLRSFRHVGPESPHESPRPPSSLSTSPYLIPRPRGDSIASDSSQRISVAAFREMAARRSMTNSPSPSSVDMSRMEPSPSLRPPPSHVVSSASPSTGTPSLSVSAPLAVSPPSFTVKTSPLLAARRTTVPLSGSSDSSEEPEESESGEDSADSSTLRPKRDATITRRTAGKASTELGHLMRPIPRIAPSASAQSGSSSRESVITRQRASASTSALQPNAAAQRASILAAEKAPVVKGSHIHSRKKLAGKELDDTSASSDSDTDSDNAPLSKYVIPKRPGSAASHATSRSRVPTKPLIDISSMTVNAPPLMFSQETVESPVSPKQAEKGKEKESPVSPTPEQVPTPVEKPTLNDRLSRLTQGVAGRSAENLLKFPQVDEDKGSRERSMPPAPTRSQTAPMDMFAPSPPSPSSPPDPPTPSSKKINGRSMSSPSATFEGIKDLSDPSPIVPTLIRERSPPPAFSVTSRPTSQLSVASQSQPPPPTVRIVQSPPERQPSPLSPSLRSTPEEPVRSLPAPLITLPPSNAFTGGGLLAGGGPIPHPHGSRPPPSSPTKRPGRPRAPSSNAYPPREDSLPPTLRPFAEVNGRRGSPARTDASSQITSASSSASSVLPAAPAPVQSKAPPPRTAKPARPRSSTLTVVPPPGAAPPPKPFAAGPRGYSPASSTGDSSSGRTPVTPQDDGEFNYSRRKKDVGPGQATSNHSQSTLGQPPRRGQRRGASVTFDETVRERGRPSAREREREKEKEERETREMEESRRKERRLTEAKAALELGKIVNGKAPLVDDDDEEAPTLDNMGPRMSMMNPMMGMGSMGGMNMTLTPPSPMAWQQQNMLSQQQYMMPMQQPNADVAFLAAHQQAMLAAKHAYQMAVAQQAMAVAEEEWERGSVGAASALSFTPRPTMGGMFPGSGYGMGVGMGGMGMNAWGGNMMVPPSSQSMYAGSVIGSELGVGTRGSGWATRSAYGEPTGPSNMFRTTGYAFPAPPPLPTGRSDSGQLGPQSRPGPRPRTRTAPSSENPRRAPPPSSWKTSAQRPA
ncbi:hypothetical protein BKA93DRAFT_823170 [Sparassis latifolia]